jgi:hypothetical protein
LFFFKNWSIILSQTVPLTEEKSGMDPTEWAKDFGDKLWNLSKDDINKLTHEEVSALVVEAGKDLETMPDSPEKETLTELHQLAKDSLRAFADKKEAEEQRDAPRLARALAEIDDLKWKSAEIMCRMIRVANKGRHEAMEKIAELMPDKFVDKIVEIDEEDGYDPWGDDPVPPKDEKEPEPEPELDEVGKLRVKLNEAIAAEEYEKAADLKDQIEKMEKK